MNELSIYGKGSHVVELDELKTIPLPASTPTYTPVSHYDLSNSIRTIGQDLLSDYQLTQEQYGIAREGKQLFAVLTFKADHSEMGLSIGFRNSTDKSMSIGIAVGSQVYVCSNLMMTGDITVMKKHTANVLETLEDVTINTLYRAQYTFGQLVKDSEVLKAQGMNDEDAFKMIGLLFGHGVLTPNQLNPVKNFWLKPLHDEFQARNAFSFYNACTEALKTSPPMNVMERHIKLHGTLVERG